LLDRALGKARDARNWRSATAMRERDAGRLVGGFEAEQKYAIVEMAAPSSASVLITGETGSGKEMWRAVAQAFAPRQRTVCGHQLFGDPGDLMRARFLATSVGLSRAAAERRIGCFELATEAHYCGRNREMPAPTQAKLLRVLEDRRCGGWGQDARLRWTCAFWQRRTKNLKQP